MENYWNNIYQIIKFLQLWKMYKTSLVAVLSFIAVQAEKCIARDFGHGSIVCVCNATYCDSTPIMIPDIPEKGNFYWYYSSKAGDRLQYSEGKISAVQYNGVVIQIDRKIMYQTIEGFGGAFTDATGINLKKLSKKTQNILMDQYFAPTGSRYNLGRIPIGGCDFSIRGYTYDDIEGDTSLLHFALAEEDYKFKIPFIQKALLINKDLKLFAAAWTAPPWMKTNDNFYGFGFLKEEYYQTFANYLLKFLEEYCKNGINLWAISTGNEPSNSFIPVTNISTMAWMPHNVGKWVVENLGPTLASSKFNATLILALDDQRFMLPWYINLLFENTKAMNYIDGIAIHFYYDKIISPKAMERTHNKYPNKFLIITEACAGDKPWNKPKVALGSWDRGELFFLDILQNINYWATGWVDWNLVLDQQGGPNWIQNYVDASIIINPENDEFYKQPMYYAIKHYSRFIDRGSKRIKINGPIISYIKYTAFLTTDNKVVVILYNQNNKNQSVTIKDTEAGFINLELKAKSMHTLIYSK
ncbi:lysosomal acid glucosylceramidase-like isoform X2 [Prorops nasuta]|uniref:lysosomal acid glucosylceramidase-like isoform X2 n=1 Tax=Prorops nasuta TaxID=863751 RepID=UPI0034CFE0B1